jgi:hypothetical protein
VNPAKATGPDNTPTRILRECAEQLAPVLRHIFPQSFNTGAIPDNWKTANIIAIYKKGDCQQPKNSRPVSLTSVCCKMMEHIVFSSIMNHLDEHNMLVDNQHGFRSKRSTETQLVQTLEDLSSQMDNKHQVDALILDFSKAFDTVPHQRLLRKLDHHGVRGKANGWIEAWLTQRTQSIVVDGTTSNPVHVGSGVPQGTVLGPLMFLLYINDIGRDIQSTIRLFADDCLLYRPIHGPEDNIILQRDLQSLVDWSDEWQMMFNSEKCYTLRVTRKIKPRQYTYTIRGQPLTQVDNYPYLGVELDHKLNWKKHISNTTCKANRTLGFLRRNLGRCSMEVKQQAYTTLIRPQMEYASSVWDPYRQYQIKELEMVQ